MALDKFTFNINSESTNLLIVATCSSEFKQEIKHKAQYKLHIIKYHTLSFIITMAIENCKIELGSTSCD